MAEVPQRCAPFLLRGLARGIDTFVWQATLVSADVLAKPMAFGGLLTLNDTGMTVFDTLFGVAALLSYTVVAEAMGGATLGKFVCGLRTIDLEGAPISWRAALIRSAAFLVDGFMFGLVAYSAIARSERRQRFGDEWAGTLVVWKGESGNQHGLGWTLGAALAVVVVFFSYAVVP